MDRNQKIERIKKEDGKVFSVSNLKILTKTLHSDFVLSRHPVNISDTGLLLILEILPKSGQGPRFTARWDEAATAMDFDMLDISTSAARKFKNNRDGYSGHHTCRSSDPDVRTFEVKIETPQGVIFEGDVTFNVTRKMGHTEQANVTATVDAVVTRADPQES